VLYGAFNGPGPVQTRDLIGNFHYRPSQKDDIQFLIQNGLGEFNYTYLLNGPGSRLALAPCPGNVASPTSPTKFGGGTAPNGASCPGGFYFKALAPGNGNIWHHYSGVGKVQWNHLIDDHSALTFRLAENFNQYIFDQPLSEANYPNDPLPAPNCPAFPYGANTPVAVVGGKLCANGTETFYGDRRSNMYLGSLDYTNTANANTTWRFGLGQEYDNNLLAYYNLYAFNPNGTYPAYSTLSVVPTHFPYAYVDGTFNTGRFTLEPGLRYGEGHYFFPGSKVVTALSPTFAGTYRASRNDVVRYSYGNTQNFIGSLYVYRQNSTTYNPNTSGGQYGPEVNHAADLMWEHQVDHATSLRVGPYVRSTSNYYALYQPYLGTGPNGLPLYGKTQPTNSGANHVFGVELGLNHTDTKPVGVSYFLSGNYENYWTTSISSLAGSFNQAQLPQNLIAQGVRIRSTDDPPFNGSLALDIHAGEWSLLPLFTYQFGTYYNVGVTNAKTGQITQPELHASAHWISNMTLERRLDKAARSTIGIYVSNLFNNVHDTTPCKSDGTGCYPFNGPLSGVTSAPGAWIYQDYTQNPQRVEFFLTLRK
jgi:hypothetical protein